MAGHFTLTNPEQCEHYARFIHRLTRRQADVIFWGNFCLTIILLIIASQMYTKASLNPSHRRIRIRCLFISLPAVAFSALAGLQIEFCDGEDLMHFYWSFWTLIQVGSLIAIMGVGVNQCYGIGGKKGPPWNVALGTPVLVIAALGHAEETGGKAIWKRISKRTLREDGNESDRTGNVSGSESELEHEVDLEAQKGRGQESEEHREERMDKTGNLDVGLDSSRASTIVNAATTTADRRPSTLAHRQSYTSSDSGSSHRGASTLSVKSLPVTREIRFADEDEEMHGEVVGRKSMGSVYRHEKQ